MPVSSLSSVAHNEVMRLMDDHVLPKHFYSIVEDIYAPVARCVAESFEPGLTIIGIQGSQGSGKSTCADFLRVLFESEFDQRTAVMSLDDFYLTRVERLALAQSVHPLFATRGVPCTHDTGLIEAVFSKARSGQDFQVPVFDKSIDDRAPRQQWQTIDYALDVLIFEGWCVGVTPESDSELEPPKNDLERYEDPQLRWRRAVNDALATDYADIFKQLDTLISLQAPSFECVFDWRLLQEQKMIERLKRAGKDASKAQTPDQIERFIAHYQRLTERALNTMPAQADYVLRLTSDHSFQALEIRQHAT